MKNITRFISENFWRGIIVALPALFAAYVAIWIFNFMEGTGNYLLSFVFENPKTGLGIILTLVLIWIAGLSAHFKFLQNLIQGIPVVSLLFRLTSRASELMSLLKCPILIEDKEKEEYKLGFITGKIAIAGQNGADEILVKVLIFPAHFAGMTKFYKPNKEVLIGIPQKEAIELIISYGVFSNNAKNSRPYALKRVKLSEILEKK